MQAKDLDYLDVFHLPNCDHKGTKAHFIYQMVERRDDGIVASGPLETRYGLMHFHFYLPDFAEVTLLFKEEIL